MILLFYFILLVKYLEDFLSEHITNLRHITCAASGLPGQSVSASNGVWGVVGNLWQIEIRSLACYLWCFQFHSQYFQYSWNCNSALFCVYSGFLFFFKHVAFFCLFCEDVKCQEHSNNDSVNRNVLCIIIFQYSLRAAGVHKLGIDSSSLACCQLLSPALLYCVILKWTCQVISVLQ